MLEIIPENRILLTHDPNTKANQRIGGWSMKTHLFYSDDFFKSSIMVKINIISRLLTKEINFF